MIRTTLTALLLVILSLGSAAAFKPAPPKPKKTFASPDGKAVLTIESDGWTIKGVTLADAGTNHTWSGSYEQPQKIAIARGAKRVLFLGSYGGACLGLGQIIVYDFDGKRVGALDLKKTIANLKDLSRAYTRICCPCFWVHGVSFSADGKLATIDVCNKVRVQLSLADLSVKRL